MSPTDSGTATAAPRRPAMTRNNAILPCVIAMALDCRVGIGCAAPSRNDNAYAS